MVILLRKKLRQLRLERGISQTYLAKKLGYSHPSGYANIEYGSNKLTLENAFIIADALGVDVSDLRETEPNFFEENLHKECNNQKSA